jgi:hypothetical protein
MERRRLGESLGVLSMAKNGLLNSVGKIFEALFLPVAGAAGKRLKKSFEERYSEKRFKRNRERVYDHASKTLGSKRQEPGQVPPKVLRDVLYHGSVCEDELSGKYFGGVLASSRSRINRDDRGSSFIQLIGRLSTYQIRSHFIFYTIFKRLCAGESNQLGRFTELQKFTIWIPFDVWQIAMDFQPNEQQGDAILIYCTDFLMRI